MPTDSKSPGCYRKNRTSISVIDRTVTPKGVKLCGSTCPWAPGETCAREAGHKGDCVGLYYPARAREFFYTGQAVRRIWSKESK